MMKKPEQKNHTKIIYISLMIILFVVFAFLLFYRVTEIPVPFNVDEAGTAYYIIFLFILSITADMDPADFIHIWQRL